MVFGVGINYELLPELVFCLLSKQNLLVCHII